MKSIFPKIMMTILMAVPIMGVQAEQALHKGSRHNAQVLQLPADIKPLLTQEMQQIQKGMMSLVPAIASGEWEAVAKTAKQLENSYIMKQKLTQEQMHSLHQSLPRAFIHLDRNFHRLAGMLAHVAEEKKPELVNFYFYKLTEACVQCHSHYAQQRFPAFTKTAKKMKPH